MKLTINPFDAASIQKAIDALDGYKVKIEGRVRKLAEQLSVLGANKASQGFAEAMYDGFNDVEVSVHETENGWRIDADGDAVCFIEFGTGVHFNSTNAAYPANRPAGLLDIGEYGKKKGRNDAWSYYDDNGASALGSLGFRKELKNGKTLIVTHGNPANMPMYYASDEMRRNILQIAREVFKDA